jgi:hypothetical protein
MTRESVGCHLLWSKSGFEVIASVFAISATCELVARGHIYVQVILRIIVEEPATVHVIVKAENERVESPGESHRFTTTNPARSTSASVEFS